MPVVHRFSGGVKDGTEAGGEAVGVSDESGVVAREGGALQTEGGRERRTGVVAGLAGGVGTDADDDPGRGACQHGEVGEPPVGWAELVSEPEVLISDRLRVPVAAEHLLDRFRRHLDAGLGQELGPGAGDVTGEVGGNVVVDLGADLLPVVEQLSLDPPILLWWLRAVKDECPSDQGEYGLAKVVSA
jgi:hypothetical protein